jgi:hypothetical protein
MSRLGQCAAYGSQGWSFLCLLRAWRLGGLDVIARLKVIWLLDTCMMDEFPDRFNEQGCSRYLGDRSIRLASAPSYESDLGRLLAPHALRCHLGRLCQLYIFAANKAESDYCVTLHVRADTSALPATPDVPSIAVNIQPGAPPRMHTLSRLSNQTVPNPSCDVISADGGPERGVIRCHKFRKRPPPWRRI